MRKLNIRKIRLTAMSLACALLAGCMTPSQSRTPPDGGADTGNLSEMGKQTISEELKTPETSLEESGVSKDPSAPAEPGTPKEPPAPAESGISKAPSILTEPGIPKEPSTPAKHTQATLAVCGDVMSHMPVINDAKNEDGTYSYARIMEAAEPYIQAADYAVANLETTLAGGPEYSGYPCFNAPDALAYNLKDMGFDLMLTANNHCMDKGFSGLSRTLDVLDEVGLAHVGTSRTEEEWANNLVIADVGGISVAFLGYTYATNGIPVPQDKPYAVNFFNTDYMTTLSTPDTEKMQADLQAAKELNPDIIAVMMHWGVEYQTTQNQYQEELADFLIANGADIVLGGHPHVLQPMGMRTVTEADGTERQGFVCYSLGNFISSQNDQYTDTTVVLTLDLQRDNESGETTVTGWNYVPMLMLDREDGHNERFELLDAYAGSDEAGVEDKLVQAISDCHNILGAEHDGQATET